MAGNEYAIRFSEEKYLTKKEVEKEMKMSIVDSIWSNVLAYRSRFYHYLPLRSIDRSSLFICLCLTVNGQMEEVDTSLSKLFQEEEKLSTVNGDSQYYKLISYTSLLKAVKNFRGYNQSEADIKDLINKKKVAIDECDRHIFNYYSSLKFIEENYSKPIDESFLADLFAVLTGQDELTYFYRVNEDNANANKILIDRVYHSAPINLIETLMNELFMFIENSQLGNVCKSLLTYYFIDYIKPFSSYNEEVAVLFAKAVLAHYTHNDKCIRLDLENLMNEKTFEVSKYNEVQKTQDVTYFALYGFNYFKKKIKESLDAAYEFSSTSLREDFYKVDEEPVEIKEEIKEPEPVIEPIKIVEEPKVKEEIIKPVPEVKTIKEEKEPVKESVPNDLAISFIPPAMDEKLAQRLTTHLLECDPELKKGEAYFYARHCTLGKIYTIQQYKKCVGCVYETARTAMDHLKELGYYQESMIKNKKVYTPVKR